MEVLMKIIVLHRKLLVGIAFFSFFFFSLIFQLSHPHSLAVTFMENSIMKESLRKEITDLTKKDEKNAYLTFDDGPTLKATGKILDILKEENIKATFFVVGKHVKEHPKLVQRAYEEGHYIANHGYHHDNTKLYKNSNSFISEIQNTDKEIGKAIGIDHYCSHIFRFPNGYMSSNYKSQKKEMVRLLSTIDYTYIDWNCLNHDSVKKYSSSQLLKNLKKSAKNKGTLVILMHDTSDVNDTSSILKDSIDYLKEQGYAFKNFYQFSNPIQK